MYQVQRAFANYMYNATKFGKTSSEVSQELAFSNECLISAILFVGAIFLASFIISKVRCKVRG